MPTIIEKGRTLSTAAPVDSERPNKPRSRKGAAARARLLDAAKAVFEEDGFLEARITDIAERAGLSHGSFYHYFDSKEEIFREVATALADLLSAPLGAVIFDHSSHAKPRERIHEGIRRFLESYRRESRIIGVIEQVSRYDAHVNDVRLEQQRRDLPRLIESIGQLQRRGLADPNLDPATAILALGAMVHRFAEMWLVQKTVECDFDDAVEQLTRLFVNGLDLRDTPNEPAAA